MVGDAPQSARLLLKSPGVLAGKPFCQAVFDYLGCTVAWEEHYEEGDYVDDDIVLPVCVAVISGPVHKLLQGERTALNALSRCSGVATQARSAVMQARALGWKGHVAGTRKTTPGFRALEKRAVANVIRAKAKMIPVETAADLVADTDTQIEGSITGTGGSKATALQNYAVDTTPPAGTIIVINAITGDNILTTTELGVSQTAVKPRSWM